jgi:hypothetical protein
VAAGSARAGPLVRQAEGGMLLPHSWLKPETGVIKAILEF